jgi:hypothetical protein
MAEHLSTAGIKKIYDLIFDRHRHGTSFLLHRSVTQPLRESRLGFDANTRANRVGERDPTLTLHFLHPCVRQQAVNQFHQVPVSGSLVREAILAMASADGGPTWVS